MHQTIAEFFLASVFSKEKLGRKTGEKMSSIKDLCSIFLALLI
jgi:hypothetical protein